MSRSLPALPLAFGALVVGVGVIALLPDPGDVRLPGRAPQGEAWKRRVADHVLASESGGNPGAQNRNTDGNGLSYGLIQWVQSVGTLGPLLESLKDADPAAFDRIFGGHANAKALLEATNSRSRSTRMSLPLWEAPWTARFTAAGKHPPFVAAQWDHLFAGEHWQGAMAVARILNAHTERAYVLFFDRSVHQGPHAAKTVAEQLKTARTRSGSVRVSYDTLLADYARRCAARFARQSPPQSGSWKWNSETDLWHRYAGPYDLFTLVSQRTRKILADKTLGDGPLTA